MRPSYEALFENLRDGVVTVTLDGTILACNPAYERLTGYSAHELTEMTYTSIMPEKWRDFEEKTVKEQIFKYGFSNVYEKEYVRKDGTVVPIELQAYLLRDSSGVPIGQQGIIRDITERKRAEREIKASEERNRVIVNTAQEGIWVLDQNHLTVFVNAHMAEMLGYEQAEMTGKSFESFMFEEDIPDHRKKMENRRAKKSERYDRRYRRRDGGAIWTHISGSSLTDSEGRFSGSFAMFTDITYLKKTESDIRAAKDAAELASKTKSQFLDIAAHELRTPLTSLTLLVQTACRKLPEGQPLIAKYLDRMILQTRRLTVLIDDLLNVSRLDRGGLPLRFVNTDLLETVRETLEDFKNLAPEREFHLFAPEQPIVLNIDPTKIGQILQNLIDNALKYTPGNSPIEIRVEPSQNSVRVSVIDQGVGVSENQQAGLFTKFYRAQTDMTLRQPGLGLGLYICRKILELHGGSIEVESRPGKGSTFSFILPLNRR